MFTLVSLRRKNPAAKALFSLFYCLCFALLLFPVLGCQMEEDDDDSGIGLNSELIGTWRSSYSDKYIIKAASLTYDDGYGGGYAGTIRYVSSFSDTAGVIIIEYDRGKEPVYYDSFDNYGDPDHIVPPKGNFLGIYYEELKSRESVKIAGAYIPGGAEEKTLSEATAAFTAAKKDIYVPSSPGPGTYTLE